MIMRSGRKPYGKKIDKFIVNKFDLETTPSWGKTVRQWLNQMHAISDRVELMRRVENNCRLPRVAKLHVGEFVGIEDFSPKKWTMKDDILTFLYELRGKWIKLQRLLHI